LVEKVEGDVDNTVFSFIPNTAEVSFYGVVKGMEDHFNQLKYDAIKGGNLSDEELKAVLSNTSSSRESGMERCEATHLYHRGQL
jgi:amidophosphoribosyltransferase